MNIGMIGIDTSHCEIFTRLLNDATDPHHLKGAKVSHVLPICSADLEISSSRAAGYLDILTNKLNVREVESIDQLLQHVDAVLVVTVDGRNHLEIIKKIIGAKKPIFLDKPAVLSAEDMLEVKELVEKHETPFMSSSALRFSEAIAGFKEMDVQSAYIYGPLPMQAAMPGYFWYGIHMVELALSLFSGEALKISREIFEEYELVKIQFAEGKSVILRGDFEWHPRFGGVVHSAGHVDVFKLWEAQKPYYASLLEEILQFFKTGISPVSVEETLRVITVVEEINRQSLT